MNLSRIQITFNTHNDNKNDSTILHVFVKNRRPDTSTPLGATDYISNHLAYKFNERREFAGINQFLGCLENVAPKTTFDDPSTHTFDIPLRSKPIPNEEIFLPVVNIHILADDSDRWIFSYTITFFFDDNRSQFSFSSNFNGVTGIILDQDNRNYCGICVENPFNRMPAVYKPQSDMVLTKVRMVFNTRGDNKNNDTTLNVHIVNRLSAASSTDILVATNLLPGQEFKDSSDPFHPSVNEVVFNQSALASNRILMRDIVLPQIFINIGPKDDDRWIFDYQIYFYFTSPSRPKDWWTAVSGTSGIILDQDNHKYADVYNGGSFPTMDPLGPANLSAVPAGYPVPTGYTDPNPKKIYISYLQKKLDDFINNRQGAGSQYPPLRKIRLDNVGRLNEDTLPESYYDLQSIVANPPAPGTPSPAGSNEPFTYNPGPSSLGQLYHSSFGDIYLNNINSQTLKATVDPTSPTPLVLEVDFDCSVPNEIVGGSSVTFEGRDLTSFTIKIHLTLTWDQTRNCVDLMSWVPEILKDTSGSDALKGQVIDVRLTGGGKVQDGFRDAIFDKLSQPASAFDSLTVREHLNSTVNSWLLGGALASDQDVNGINYPNGCTVTGQVTVESDAQGQYIALRFNGPRNLFVPAPPANWPPPNFTPGTLANIDHIVVLTMENRSFDHMLGYLSLPPEKGGMGRTDVDGLKGGEINYVNGVACPSLPFAPLDTIMTPDPPHSWEPVTRAINGGKMDGFAQAYYDERGMDVAARIMKYHTAANVPVYDALARDFAICHRWFAPFPGPTFCNRFHELTGFLNIDADGFWETDNSSPLRAIFTATIFDYLTQHGVSWKYFEHFYCFLRFFQSHTFDTQNIASFDDPVFGFESLARAGALPSVSFIDPHFIELPPDGNCDGPPADIQKGQDLVRRIVQAVVASPKWSKTLLIITYDEHGGFYDHVPPPPATKNSPESVGTYGIRVPLFVVSPWVKGGTVFGHDGIVVTGGGGNVSTESRGAATPSGGSSNPNLVDQLRPLHFDHTSILKTIARRFMSDKPPYLSPRYADAADLSVIVGNQMSSLQFRPFIPYQLVYGPSQKRLDVHFAATTPGTILWQYDPNDTVAQQFSFEDAGSGHVYIRTHTGSLYLTATQNGVIQDIKYPPGTNAGGKNSDAQRWAFSSTAIAITQRNNFAISNAAFPGLVLQPSGGSNNSGVAVILAKPTGTVRVGLGTTNPWQVTSPLISTAIVAEP
jgi:hypothetical protein